MKKLIIISSVACLTIFATIFTACNKNITKNDAITVTNKNKPQYRTIGPDETIVYSDENNTNEIRLYLDEVNVPHNTFSFDDSNLVYAIVGRPISQTNNELSIYAFTSMDKYFEFGDTYNMQFRELATMQNELSLIAESNNLTGITNFEAIPQWYIDLGNEKMDLLKYNLKKTRLVNIGWVWDFMPKSASSSTPILPFMPAMILGWNNRESAFEQLGTYNFTTVYDKFWFNKIISSYNFWGWNTVDFNGISYMYNGQQIFPFASWNNTISSQINVAIL